jgi:hypothetical protein
MFYLLCKKFIKIFLNNILSKLNLPYHLDYFQFDCITDVIFFIKVAKLR